MLVTIKYTWKKSIFTKKPKNKLIGEHKKELHRAALKRSSGNAY